MNAYFEYRTIEELLDDDCNYCMGQEEFTLNELSQYDGMNGKPAYAAIQGMVYDVSSESLNNTWIIAGKDLTEQFNFYYRMNQIINKAPKIGIINDDSIEDKSNLVEKQISCKLRSDKLRDNAESLKEEAMNRRNKKCGKKNYKYDQCVSFDKLVEVEKALKETFNQVLELQIEILKCVGPTTDKGVATGVNKKINKVTGGKNISPGDFVGGLAGGAAGGAGGGLGAAASGSTTKSSEVGGSKANLGPGTTGGATGGALGSTGRDLVIDEMTGTDLECTNIQTESTDEII